MKTSEKSGDLPLNAWFTEESFENPKLHLLQEISTQSNYSAAIPTKPTLPPAIPTQPTFPRGTTRTTGSGSSWAMRQFLIVYIIDRSRFGVMVK